MLLRDFQMVKDEILWMGKNKIQNLLCADSNFGILERDIDIIDFVVSVHKEYGYPKRFHASYTKNSSERVFEINKKLHACQMSRGATLSFQSLNPEALSNVGRQNIKLEDFLHLMNLYNSQNIPTYTEMILGLPGETYESWCSSFDVLLESGQHTSINIYNCEVLCRSKMASDEYLKTYEIETAKIPLNQYHIAEQNDDMQEFSEIVIKTCSMSKIDWLNGKIFSCVLQYCHNLGLLQAVAIFFHHEKNILYSEFYKMLISYWESPCRTTDFASRLLKKARDIFISALQGASIVYRCNDIKKILWPIEEGCFIETISHLEVFYHEIRPFILSLGIDDKQADELIEYQKNIIRVVSKHDFDMHFKWDWHGYFEAIYNNSYKPLKYIPNKLHVKTRAAFKNLEEYATNVVWYGRKGGKFFYTDITKEYSSFK